MNCERSLVLFSCFKSISTLIQMLRSEDIINRLQSTLKGYHAASEDTFKSKEKYFPKYIKKGVIAVEDEEDDQYHARNQIFCNIPGCERFFQSVFNYQSHYNSQHRFICSQCKKNLPTSHLLDLHISENHDSYFSVLSKTKPMFLCFLEHCAQSFSTPEDRKDHCISVHKFPMNFRFENLCLVGKKSQSMMDGLENTMIEKKVSSTKPISNFSFGHGKKKSFSKMSYGKVLTNTDVELRNVLEDSKTVNDLLNSLPK